MQLGCFNHLINMPLKPNYGGESKAPIPPYYMGKTGHKGVYLPILFFFLNLNLNAIISGIINTH